jgi:hypothetical protein
MSTHNPTALLPPEFRCPYLKPCLLREGLRIILAAILAWAGLQISGCNGSLVWKGMGVDLKTKWFDDPAPPPTSRPAP